MKPLEKKLCISICLTQLFEEVKDEGDGGKEKAKESACLVASRAPIQQEAILLRRRTNRGRKYRHEWLKFRKESYYCGNALQKLEKQEGWRLILETIPKGDEASSLEMKQRHGDASSWPQLKLSQDNESREKAEKEKVDIAVSTSFLTLPTEIIQKDVGTVPGRDQATCTKQTVNASTQTDGEDDTMAKTVRKSKFHETGISVYRYCAEYSLRTRILSGNKSNDNAFLAMKSVKRTNLSLRNDKSTQMDVGNRLNVESFAYEVEEHQKSTFLVLTEVSDQDKKLEELFRCKKFEGNSLKKGVQIRKSQLLGKEISQGSQMIRPRILSDTEISQQRMDAMIRERTIDICTRGQSLEDCSAKVSEKTENFFCYPMTIPWEMNPVVIEEDFLDDSFDLLRGSRWSESDLSTYRIETECEILPRLSSRETNEQVEIVSECSNPEIASLEKNTKLEVEDFLMDITDGKSEKLLSVKETNSEDSVYLHQMIVRTLGPRIIEEVKQISLRKELSGAGVGHSLREETPPNAVTVEWELEIEIQAHDNGNYAGLSELVKKNSNPPALKAAAEELSNIVILLRPTESGFHAMADPSSQHSFGNEFEECFLRDEKMRKIYRASFPRHLLLATEQKLKEIGRG